MDHAERWLPVPGYAAWYEVSDAGNVCSLGRAGTRGGLLVPQLNSRGYRVVRLCKYGRVRTVTVGSLVLRTFAGAPRPGQRAAHGPKGPRDDSLANLRWALAGLTAGGSEPPKLGDMRLADCTPGREVIIGMKFLALGLGGVTCTVLDTRPAPGRPEDNPAYPHGMVQVRLPDDVPWSCREPWIGPEDLGCLDAAMREQILGS